MPQGVHVVKALNTLDLEDLQGEKNNFRILWSRKFGQFTYFFAEKAAAL